MLRPCENSGSNGASGCPQNACFQPCTQEEALKREKDGRCCERVDEYAK
jgi:hypothetical protein